QGALVVCEAAVELAEGEVAVTAQAVEPRELGERAGPLGRGLGQRQQLERLVGAVGDAVAIREAEPRAAAVTIVGGEREGALEEGERGVDLPEGTALLAEEAHELEALGGVIDELEGALREADGQLVAVGGHLRAGRL